MKLRRCGDEFHAFYVVPIGRYPDSRPDLDDKILHPDHEQWSRQYWGAHFRRADFLPNYASKVCGEVYAYGFNEDDTKQYPTVDRRQTAIGARLYRKPQSGQWDIDLEGAWRWGTRSESPAPTARDLGIRAGFLFGAVGYSFGPCRKTLAFW